MTAVKAGDKVRVVTRDVTSEDPKNGLYFAYFGGLTGLVDRVYDDGSVCVDVDLDSLTDEIRERHLQMQETERQRWISGLSDEVRGRLTAEQKQLRMSYKILVSRKDLEPNKGGKPQGETKQDSAATQGKSGDEKGSDTPGPSGSPKAEAAPARPRTTKADEGPKRLSEADLSAAEEAFLRSRQQGS